MKIKKRTEIETETHELTVIRIGERQTIFCAFCGKITIHYGIARAAIVLNITETNCFRLVENRLIHATESALGSLLVCRNSLTELMGKIENETDFIRRLLK